MPSGNSLPAIKGRISFILILKNRNNITNSFKIRMDIRSIHPNDMCHMHIAGPWTKRKSQKIAWNKIVCQLKHILEQIVSSPSSLGANSEVDWANATVTSVWSIFSRKGLPGVLSRTSFLQIFSLGLNIHECIQCMRASVGLCNSVAQLELFATSVPVCVLRMWHSCFLFRQILYTFLYAQNAMNTCGLGPLGAYVHDWLAHTTMLTHSFETSTNISELSIRRYP